MNPPKKKRPLQKEILATELGGYAIRLRADLNGGAPYIGERLTHWVDFELFKCVGEDDVGMLYGEDISLACSDLEDATLSAWGFLKWDGCTQFWIDEPVHVDSKEELDRLFAAIHLARAEAGVLCKVEC